MTNTTTAKPVTTLKNVEGAKRTDMHRIPVDQLHFEDGFNLREDSPEVIAHIRAIADAVKAGDRMPALDVRLVDGKVIVDDGHCRTRGILLAESEGFEYGLVDCQQSKVKPEERVFLMLGRNKGLDLTPLETAFGYQRLRTEGFSGKDIAARVGKTPAHVSQYLKVAAAETSVHDRIRNGELSFTNAINLCSKHGENAAQVVEDVVNGADGGKVSIKDVQAVNGTKVSRNVPKKLYRSSTEAAAELIGTASGDMSQLNELLSADDETLEKQTVNLTLNAKALRDLILAQQQIAQVAQA